MTQTTSKNDKNNAPALDTLQKNLKDEVDAQEKQKNLEAVPAPQQNTEAVPAPAAQVAPAPTESKNADAAFTADALRTKEIIERDFPKVMISLPCYIGEKPGVSEDSACINGYRWTVKKGVMVKVPEPVARLFMDHYNIQMSETEVGQKNLVHANAERETALR